MRCVMDRSNGFPESAPRLKTPAGSLLEPAGPTGCPPETAPPASNLLLLRVNPEP